MHIRMKRRPRRDGGASLQFVVAVSRRTPAGSRSSTVATWTSDAEAGPGYVVSIADALAGAERWAAHAAVERARWARLAEQAREAMKPEQILLNDGRSLLSTTPRRVHVGRDTWKPDRVLRQAAEAERQYEAAARHLARLRVAAAGLPDWRWPGAASVEEQASAVAEAKRREAERIAALPIAVRAMVAGMRR